VKNPVPRRDWDEAHLINAAVDIHHDDPAFGYRFIAGELEAAGIAASENRVQRLCSQQRIWSVFARKRGLSRKAGPPVHDDLVQRDFTASRPDQLWLTDITEHPPRRGEAVPVRRQGRLLRADRGLLDGLPDESLPRSVRAAERDRAARASRHGRGALRQGPPSSAPTPTSGCCATAGWPGPWDEPGPAC
jgi:putative transposase